MYRMAVAIHNIIVLCCKQQQLHLNIYIAIIIY